MIYDYVSFGNGNEDIAYIENREKNIMHINIDYLKKKEKEKVAE